MVPEHEDVTEPPARNFAWLVIFTDLTALMLAFFVLLFSMSNVKVDRWDSVTDALSQTLNPSSTKQVAAATARFSIGSVFRKRAVNLDYLYALLEKAAAGDPLLGKSRLLRLEDRLVVAMPGGLLFSQTSSRAGAELSESGTKAMFSLGGVLRNVGNQVAVKAHFDSTLVPGAGYTSAWELSLARASAVANSLKQAGYTEAILALGSRDKSFRELPGLSEKEHRSLARRVEIVVAATVGESP